MKAERRKLTAWTVCPNFSQIWWAQKFYKMPGIATKLYIKSTKLPVPFFAFCPPDGLTYPDVTNSLLLLFSYSEMGLLPNLAPVRRPGRPAAPLTSSDDVVGSEAQEGVPVASTSSAASNPYPQRGRLIRDESGNVVGCSLPEDEAKNREAEQWPPKPLSEEEPPRRPTAAKTDLVRGECGK